MNRFENLLRGLAPVFYAGIAYASAAAAFFVPENSSLACIGICLDEVMAAGPSAFAFCLISLIDCLELELVLAYCSTSLIAVTIDEKSDYEFTVLLRPVETMGVKQHKFRVVNDRLRNSY